MAEVDAGGDANGFKLFGAIIVTEDKKQATKAKAAAEGSSGKDAAVADATEAAKGAEALPCPRCRSKETKFCYFNNYNVNQPRHFCRACHRYWTAGGTLRNVPVGAGRRRTRPAIRGGGGPYVIEYASPCSDARTEAQAWGGGLTGGLR